MSSEELRARAAHYRDLALDCSYPEGVNLLVMLADVHEEEAAQRAAEPAERSAFFAD